MITLAMVGQALAESLLTGAFLYGSRCKKGLRDVWNSKQVGTPGWNNGIME
jgi:hypothetical protein